MEFRSFKDFSQNYVLYYKVSSIFDKLFLVRSDSYKFELKTWININYSFLTY